MPGSASVPGPVRRLALTGFRRMPRWARVRLIRLVAPSHTVGALCLLEHEGTVLLLRQRHRHGWTLPGGLVNRGETAAQAVVREVAEETGLVVEVGLPVGTVVEPRTRRVDVVFHVVAGAAPVVTAGSEAVSAAWLRPEQAGAVDEPTAQALALFARSRDVRAYRGRLHLPDPPARPAPPAPPAPGPGPGPGPAQ